MAAEDEDVSDGSGFPKVGTDIKWLALYLSVDFYPAIKTPRGVGAQFFAKLADAIELERVDLQSNQWTYIGGGTCDGMQVVVERQQISLAANHPRNAEDFYKLRNTLILNTFKAAFSPEAILRSSAMARGLIYIEQGEDSRAFLAGSLMFLHPKKLNIINRPLDLLGVRMYFPPDENVEWGVDVRAESWADDPTKLYLAADADWSGSRPWDEDAVERTIESMSVVTEFMKTRLMNFLHQPPFLGFDDEGDEDDANQDN
jgi:hypothetical protein